MELVADLMAYSRVFALGEVAVEVATSADPAGAELLDHLGDFYAPLDRWRRPGEWRVHARVGEPDAGMARNAFGVGYSADVRGSELTLRATEVTDLQVTCRKVVRELFLADCERAGYAMMHAAAVLGPVARDGRRPLLVFTGDAGAGKTTLALRLMLDGWQLLSNDHLIGVVAPDPAGGTRIAVTGLPTAIPVKVGTLAELADRLPEPWDAQGIDLAAFGQLTAAQLRAVDAGVLFTYPQLGQPSPTIVWLDDSIRPVIVRTAFTAAGEPATSPTAAGDPAAVLTGQLRTDWALNPRLHQQHVPGPRRGRAELDRAGAGLVDALTARAPVLTWTHHGDPAPLLTALSRTGGRDA